MPGPESLWHWLAQSALVGSVLSAIGCVGVLACRQPVKRLRLIELTLAACLLAPLIGTLPGWPTWPLPWLAGGAPVGAAVLDEPTIPDESLVPAPVAEAHAPRLADGPAFDQQVASAETGSEAGGDLAADESDAGLPAFDEPFWEEAEFLVADESGDAPAAGIREKLPRLLVAVYFAMLALLSLRGALGIFGLWRLHRSAAAAPACCGERLAEIAGPGGRRVRRVRLLLSDRIDAPVTYLWGRPVIVLPRRMCPGERGASASRWRPHESGDHGIGDPPAGSRPPLARHVDFALAHEWSHIERGDLWTWYLAAAAQWVFCYQPLVWWLRRQMRLCQDFLADASAARHGGDDAADYAEFLVRLARGRLYSPAAPALGVIDRRSHLHRRIAMLLEHRRWIEPRCRRGWTLTAAALALALTAGGSMLRLQADTAPAAPVAELPKQAAPEPPPSVDSPGIREIVDEAIKATGTRSGLPALLARAGEVRAALELAERMPKKSDELSAIAAAQARAGDRAGAIETAASIGDDSERNRAFVRIAETVAERGDPTAVAEILPRITNPDGKAQVLFRIAELHAERGDVQGVVDTAVKVVDATSSAGIAAYNAGRTPWDAAMSAVGASRTRTNVLVARAFVKAGKIDAALDTLGRIEDEYLKFPVVLDIARIRAERGDLDAALQTAETIEAPIYKASVLASLAEFLFDRAKPAGAREVLDKALAVEVPPGGGYAGYPNDAYASHVLQTAAVVQMKLGDRDAARKTFRKAVNSIIPQNRRLVIEAQAQAGDIEGALENARLHVRHAGGVAMQSYELIAVVQAKAGDFDGALATAERSEAVATGASATALAQVAAAQRAAGQFDEAAATFRRAVEIVPNRGGRALHMVAYHQAKAGDAKTAFEWARAEPDNAVRTAALRGVALGILERREADASHPQPAPAGEAQPRAGPRGDEAQPKPQARHRAVLLDWVKFPTELGAASLPPEVLLVDFDSGEVLARKTLGYTPDLCVSPDGRLLAIVSMFTSEGRMEPAHRLTVLRTSDLSEVNAGYLPYNEAQRYHDYLPQPIPVMAFSRDANDTVLLPHASSEQAREGRAKFGAQWSAVEWRKKSTDERLPTFSLREKSPIVQHEGRTPVLSTIRWPEVDLSSRWFGTIITVSFETGDVVQRLVVTDNPGNPTVDGTLDPAEFQERERQPMGAERSNGYSIGTPEGRIAFHMPERDAPGRIMRIDLSEGRPKIVARSEKVYDDLFPLRGAASETAGALFVGRWRGMRGPSAYLPSHVLVFDGKTLELQADLAMKMDIMELAVSHDGRYLYVVGRDIAVVDIASREVVKRFGGARVPSYLLPLP